MSRRPIPRRPQSGATVACSTCSAPSSGHVRTNPTRPPSQETATMRCPLVRAASNSANTGVAPSATRSIPSSRKRAPAAICIAGRSERSSSGMACRMITSVTVLDLTIRILVRKRSILGHATGGGAVGAATPAFFGYPVAPVKPAAMRRLRLGMWTSRRCIGRTTPPRGGRVHAVVSTGIGATPSEL